MGGTRQRDGQSGIFALVPERPACPQAERDGPRGPGPRDRNIFRAQLHPHEHGRVFSVGLPRRMPVRLPLQKVRLPLPELEGEVRLPRGLLRHAQERIVQVQGELRPRVSGPERPEAEGRLLHPRAAHPPVHRGARGQVQAGRRRRSPQGHSERRGEMRRIVVRVRVRRRRRRSRRRGRGIVDAAFAVHPRAADDGVHLLGEPTQPLRVRVRVRR
mmetsp:Transcript_42624/g.129426  ORF Transcript_42624/g.129426 Transcript_42624/m.129426 type:complete len:215 (+) Transcript_42624:1237-1881(+)